MNIINLEGGGLEPPSPLPGSAPEYGYISAVLLFVIDLVPTLSWEDYEKMIIMPTKEVAACSAIYMSTSVDVNLNS